MDPLQKLYPQLSPYSFVDNNPIRLVDADGKVITIPDGKGGQIVYTPGMKTDGYSAVSAKHINYLNQAYAGKQTKARMDKLTASDVNYHVRIGTNEEVDYKNPGGVTTYNFEKKQVEVKVVEDGDVTYAILGDELVHSEQFEDGKLGLSNVDGSPSSFGYDLQDEIESKRGSVDVLNTKGIDARSLDPNGKYESTKAMIIIQSGQDTDENMNKWLKETTRYKKHFKGDRDEMGESISPEMDIKKAPGQTAYRKGGKTIINSDE